MTVIVNDLQSPLGNKYIEDIEANNLVQEDVTGTNSTIYYVEIDNTLNSTAVYFKIWDSASPDVSADDPVHKIKVEALDSLIMHIPEGLMLNTGLSYACVTTSALGVSGAPNKNVIVRLITS